MYIVTVEPVVIPCELLNIAQVTCLLTVAMIEGQGTPYWFIEKLLPEGSRNGGGDVVRGLPKGALARLREEVSPLSWYLLKTYEILDACQGNLAPEPLSEKEQIWLLERMQDLVPCVYTTSTTAEKERNPLRIIGQLVQLLQTMGGIMLRILPGRMTPTTLRDLQDAMHGVAALYQAIGYASREQRDVLTSELDLFVPVIADVEDRLRQALSA